MNDILHWLENGSAREARWQSEAAAPLPQELVLVDDSLTAA